MDAARTRLVWQRARSCCEYCRMPQAGDDAPFEIDHIVARKHRGSSAPGNLCLSCFYCNSFKGSDLASLDPKTRRITPLFNPRRHKWSRHFRWQGPSLVGRTAIGRATVALPHINDEYHVELHAGLMAEGIFPPA
jgi:5-methylcytosine-specific restriction endonuclease McrA